MIYFHSFMLKQYCLQIKDFNERYQILRIPQKTIVYACKYNNYPVLRLFSIFVLFLLVYVLGRTQYVQFLSQSLVTTGVWITACFVSIPYFNQRIINTFLYVSVLIYRIANIQYIQYAYNMESYYLLAKQIQKGYKPSFPQNALNESSKCKTNKFYVRHDQPLLYIDLFIHTCYLTSFAS